MDLTTLIIQLIAGALGGNATGNISKDVNLGPLGNTVAGALGGGVLGQIFNALLGIGGTAATTAASSGLDFGTIVSAFATGGVGGGITALVVGYLKSMLAR